MSQTIVFNTIPFSLKNVSQVNDSTLLISFTNNPLAQNSVNPNDGLNINNYQLSGPVINYVVSVDTVSTDSRSLLLNLKTPLMTGDWTLLVSNIQDVDSLDLSNPKQFTFAVDYSTLQPDLGQGADNQQAADVIAEHITPMFNGQGWQALIAAIAKGDEYINELSQQIYDQLFLSSATGEYLTSKASDNGFDKPKGIGISDDLFRELAIKASAEKVTLQSFLQILKIYYGEDAIKASIDSGIEENYNLNDGDDLIIKVDGVEVPVIFHESDSAVLNNTKAQEAASVITRTFEDYKLNAYAKPVFNPATSKYYIRIYSGALGLRGSVAVLGGTANSVFGFTPNKTYTINSKQRLASAAQASTEVVCDVVLPATTQIVTRKEGTGSYVDANYKIAILGPVKTTTLSRTGSIVTVTTETSHNLSVGNSFFFGPGNSDFMSGVKTVTSVLSGTSFAYTEAGEDSTLNGTNYICPSYRNNGEVTLTTAAPHNISTNQYILVDNLQSFIGVQSKVSVTNLGAILDGGNKDSAGVTLLNDGRVLIAGGTDDLTNKKVFTFDSSTNTFTFQTELSFNFLRGEMITLLDGKVLIIGGDRSGTPTAQIFDPITNSVLTTSPPTINRQRFTATLLKDGRVLVVGGAVMLAGGSIGAIQDTVEIYDPATATWSAGPSLQVARYAHTATLLNNGNVLIVGGSTAIEDTPCEIYNPNNNSWHTVADLPGFRAYHTATLLDNDKVMIVGGADFSSSYLSSTQIYKDSSETWSIGGTNGDLPIGMSAPSAVKLPNGNVLLVGGTNGSGDITDNVWIYNPVLDQWKQSNYNVSPRRFLKTILLSQGSVYISPGTSIAFDNDIYNNDQSVFSSGKLNGIMAVSGVTNNTIKYKTPECNDIAAISTIDSKVGVIQAFKAKDKEYVGPYILEPDTSAPAITSIKTNLTQSINQGQNYSILNVSDATHFDDSGYILINFGYETQVGPIRFYSKISDTQLSIDSKFVFPKTIELGAELIQLKQLGSFLPSAPETSGCFYITDSSSGRAAASKTLDDIAAVGISINKTVTYPNTIGLGNGEIKTNSSGPKLNDAIYIWGSEEDVKSKRGF